MTPKAVVHIANQPVGKTWCGRPADNANIVPPYLAQKADCKLCLVSAERRGRIPSVAGDYA